MTIDQKLPIAKTRALLGIAAAALLAVVLASVAAAQAARHSAMTVMQFLEAALPPDRYADFEPMIGAFREGDAPITLGDFYETRSLEDLRAAIVEDFDAADMIPALDAPIAKDASETVTPGWRAALRVCTKRDITGPSNLYYKKSRCIDPNDTLDWLVIQIALRRSVEAGASFVLDLPRLAGSYAISQALSLPSKAHLRWLPDERGRYSYMMLVGHTDNGAMLVNMNPYSTYLSPTMVPAVVRDIWIDNPRIDGRGIPGENGIAFARGAKRLRITGGEIRNLRFDPAIQGGRAVQCEQGCEDLTIEGLSIRNATFGISSVVHQANQPLLADPGMMQSSLTARDIRMDDVEGPFIFSNSKLDAGAEPDRQKIRVDGVTITNSGALRRARIKAGNQSAFSYVEQSGKRVWCHDRAALSRVYDLADGFHGPQSLGIFYFQAPRNVDIRNVSIVNDASYPKIGGLVRGESGSNISISNITFEGKARAVFNLTGGITGTTTDAVKLKNVVFEDIRAVGDFDRPVLAATDVPIVRARKNAAPKDACTVIPSRGKFGAISWVNTAVNGRRLDRR